MCTVSFVNANGKIIITSNRDEKTLRPNAIEPSHYSINNKNVIFPKDMHAGGTWYAVNENSTVLVLLNGAEERHQLRTGYRKSRGLIVLDLIGSESVAQEWDTIDLDNIEPFTLVLYENEKLYQLRWDEVAKSKLELDPNQSHIWSSSTLYPLEIRRERADWFYNFLDMHTMINEADMLNFHRYTESENTEHGLVIDREGLLKTLSITQTVIEKNKVVVHYSDLISETDFSNTFISV
ncbi:NRDE family protein [Flavobacterium sp.]